MHIIRLVCGICIVRIIRVACVVRYLIGYPDAAVLFGRRSRWGILEIDFRRYRLFRFPVPDRDPQEAGQQQQVRSQQNTDPESHSLLFFPDITQFLAFFPDDFRIMIFIPHHFSLFYY